MLRSFTYLYDLEVIDEDVFLEWKEDINETYPGKGKALFEVLLYKVIQHTVLPHVIRHNVIQRNVLQHRIHTACTCLILCITLRVVFIY